MNIFKFIMTVDNYLVHIKQKTKIPGHDNCLHGIKYIIFFHFNFIHFNTLD